MRKNVISSIAEYVPSPVLETIMQMMVAHYYNNNEYNEVYRHDRTLTRFEYLAIDKYLDSLASRYPNIMDIGCGAGMPFDAYFVNRGCSITGIDISKTQISKAMVNIPTARFINSDFLKYSDETLYDGMVLLYSLFHIQREYHPYVMQKVYNMLMPQGKVLLNIRKEDCGKLKYRKNFCGKPMCWSHYDSATFLSIIHQIGFRYEIIGDEKAYGSSESHLWLILSKV